MPDKVTITKSKLDSLANTIAAKTGESLPLTIDQMKTALYEKCNEMQEQIDSLSPTKILVCPEQTVTPENWGNYCYSDLKHNYTYGENYISDLELYTLFFTIDGNKYLFDSVDVICNGVLYSSLVPCGDWNSFGAPYDSNEDSYDFSEYPFSLTGGTLYTKTEDPVTISYSICISGFFGVQNGKYNLNKNGIKTVVIHQKDAPTFKLTVAVSMKNIRSLNTIWYTDSLSGDYLYFSEVGAYRNDIGGDTDETIKTFDIYIPKEKDEQKTIYLPFKAQPYNDLAVAYTGFAISNVSSGITAQMRTQSTTWNIIGLTMNSDAEEGSFTLTAV